MNKYLLSCGIGALLLSGASVEAAPAHRGTFDALHQSVHQRLTTGASWHNGLAKDNRKPQQRVITQIDDTVGPVSYWGSLNTPDGQEWMYSIDFATAMVNEYNPTITGADIAVYDADLKLYKKFTVDFELGEHEVTINSVQVSPTLTRKFFNINDAYELMIYVHAATDDYQGHYYSLVYTLDKDCSFVTKIEGDCIAAVNTATESWSENYTLMFMREQTVVEDENYGYYLYFDVYSKAGWGGGCTLQHTFTIDYSLIAGAGNYALPVLMTQHNGDIYYALPRYEKPYFVSDWSEDITPDNNFIIDLYDSKFNIVKTTTIPMELEEGALFSFPGLGELNGFDDVTFGVYGPDNEPMYVVGVENYIASTDEYSTSLYVYDSDGNYVKTLVNNADDYLQMSPVKGCEQQFCFYYSDDQGGYFKFIDVPSGQERAEIPARLNEWMISSSLDRVASGSSYKYVSSLTTADVDDDGNVLHSIAWFNADGTFDRFDTINLGNNVALAMPNITASVLDPYLFNTTDNIEYMFLVKEFVDMATTTKTEEHLRIYSDDSTLLLDLGPKSSSEYLNSIFIFNPGTVKAQMVVSYYGNDTYTLHHVALPLEGIEYGQGTVDDPYIIVTPGEMRAIQNHLDAYYELGNDIDFGGAHWTGISGGFTGSLDGNGHKVMNVDLEGQGIFHNIYNGATVKNLAVENVTMKASGVSGVIAGTVSGGDNNGSVISNVSVNNLAVTGRGEVTFGGICGNACLMSSVNDCWVNDAVIDLQGYANAGGIVGSLTTLSTVGNCYFNGEISASVAGGIVGTTGNGDEKITNCHANVAIDGAGTAGGILGASKRTPVSFCYAEGTINANKAGGILGSVEANFSTEATGKVAEHCISAVAVTGIGDGAVAHRIAGFTSSDELFVDWESDDPSVDYSDPSTYPYVPGPVETALNDNYAVGVDRIDTDIDDSIATTEGKTLAAEDLQESFLIGCGWMLGNDAFHPWALVGNGLKLYFEEGILGLSHIDASQSAIKYVGGCVVLADQPIIVYNIAGAVVAAGFGQVDVTTLAPGVYVAVSGSEALKFAK